MSEPQLAAQRRKRLERRYRRAATIAVLGLVLTTVAVFAKQNPFAGHYEVRAVFGSANQLKRGDEVRIAGMRVGEVSEIDAGPGSTSLVTLEISDDGRPVHADATLAIVPRLILEGNLFVDLRPGTPNAPELRSGATIPRARTTSPVQLDQLLTVFDVPTRGALHRSIAAFADGLGPAPRRGGGRRVSGAAGLRRAVRELDGALDPAAQLSRAARGTDPGDLGRALRSSSDFTSQLATDPEALADLVTNYRRFTGALAAQDRELRATVSGFDEVLREAPASLRRIDRALPAVTRFGDALRPALRRAPRTLRSTERLLAQIDAIVSTGELPALLDALAPVTATLPRLEDRLGALMRYVVPVTRCVTTRIVPTLNTKISDGPNTTGDPVWLDLMHAFTGLTGASPNFDGNATTIRLGVTQGETSLNGILPGLGRVVGGGPKIQGVRPTWLGYDVDPPYRPDEPCTNQALPDLTKRDGGPPASGPLSAAARIPRKAGGR